MADKVIENLITQLTFDYNQDILKKFDVSLKGIITGLTAVVTTAAGAGTAMFAFAKKTAVANDETGKLSNTVDASLETMQALGFAAELNGGSIDSMNSSVGNLSTLISETSRGVGAGAEAFGMFGISVVDAEGKLKSVDNVLFEISDSLQALGTEAERREFAGKLGISDDLILTLKDGSAALKGFIAEAKELDFAISGDDAKAAADFNDELLRNKKLLESISNFVGTNLVKQFIPYIKMMNEWIKANRELIKQNITAYIERIQKFMFGVLNVGTRVFNIIESLAMAMGGWKNAIVAVSAAIFAMNASALLMPIIAAAIGAGILLIIEDLQKFAEGGDSALGDLAERFPSVEAGLRTLLDLMKMVVDGWELIFTSGDEALDGLKIKIKDIGKSIKEFITSPLRDFEIKKPESFNLDFLSGIFGGASGGGVANNSSVSTNNTINNNTSKSSPIININGGDLNEVRTVVGQVLTETYQSAEINLSSQVDN